MMYEYFYNGGGVAIGDVNGDSLQDIYFSGNMVSNKLYLNKGNMQFEDITSQSGAGSRNGPWKTGVTMADVNGDGLLDIYVCFSGNLRPERRRNELYINQGTDARGIPRFAEQAEKYGLASDAYSTQAYFFDYDRDGDLDMFLLNHRPEQLPPLDEVAIAEMLKQKDAQMGVRLYKNDKNYFTDVTDKSGLHSSQMTYGLSAGIADIDGDGWTDIYISNDYIVPDYLYINNKNGTFTNKLPSQLSYTSHFSMGCAVTDINNDGLSDIYTLDMLPEDNKRQKQLFAPDNYEKFDLNVRSGLYYQYMRNMLHVNNGNGSFSEMGQMAGISNTDWSWAPLFADFDNDGWKDLFVTNGYLRDYTNMDFMKYMNDYVQKSRGTIGEQDILQLVHQMPASNVSNYVYKNTGNFSFQNTGQEWGINVASNSNGAAYADLDNDGDLDLIVNNINQPAFIYQNQAGKQLAHQYLQIKLEGEGKNTQGLGAKVMLYSGGNFQYQEQMPASGYQSSISPVLHFGLATVTSADSLHVVWPSGKVQLIKDIKAGELLVLKETDAVKKAIPAKRKTSIFNEVKSSLAFIHKDAQVNDFKRQPLLINPLSFGGPCLAKADVNGDGLEDVFAGGGNGQVGSLFLQTKDGRFVQKTIKAFEKDLMSDDTDAIFFDANGDKHPDLYVCSGGYDNYSAQDPLLQDRLYINDGKGNFSRNTGALPAMLTSTSCVRAADFNNDGFDDVFVGGRVVPGQYPQVPQSYLLLNDGKGNFSDVTANMAKPLQKIGMVTDAAWVDMNGDASKELIVVGEWMPVTVFANDRGKLTDQTNKYINKTYKGWWNKLLVQDFNKDGKPDLVIANQGLNTQCKATEKEPAELYFKDFDDNGSVDPILCFYIQGKSYPYVTRDELLDQMSIMRTRFTNYKSYADATIKDIFTEQELQGAGRLAANYLQTAYFESGKDGKLHEKNLPAQAQVSPVYSIATVDCDYDGNEDLLLGGNISNARLRFGKSEANYGILLKGDGKGNFTYVPQSESGFKVQGDVRSILSINDAILFGINGQPVKAYKIQRPQ
jgi:hypothetical protein